MICTEIDKWMQDYIENNTIWFVKLNNDLTVYMDDNRPGLSEPSAWLRLKTYCKDNSLYIVEFCLRNRSNYHSLPQNQDGYYFRKMVRGSLFGKTKHFFVVGTIQNNSANICRIMTPELLLDRIAPYEVRTIDPTEPSVIHK